MKTWLSMTATAAAITVLAGCGANDTLGAAAATEDVPHTHEAVVRAFALPNADTIDELVGNSKTAVIGTVVDVQRDAPQIDPEGETVTTFRTLTIQVNDPLVGAARAGDRLTVHDFGWQTYQGGPEKPMRTSSEVRLEKGDRGLVFLVDSAQFPGSYDYISGAGVYRLIGEEIEDDKRESVTPVVAEVRALSVADARGKIKESKARQGKS